MAIQTPNAGDNLETLLRKILNNQVELLNNGVVASEVNYANIVGISSSKLLGRTSLGVGAAELIDFESGTFTPTFTFSTPGDLSVVYTLQQGQYLKLGSLVWLNLRMQFTPTHTTASGDARFSLPLAASAAVLNPGTVPFSTGSVITFPAGTTAPVAHVTSGQTYGTWSSIGSGTAGTPWGTGQFPTATARVAAINGWYLV